MVVIHAAGSCLHIQLRHEAAECVIFSLTHTHTSAVVMMMRSRPPLGAVRDEPLDELPHFSCTLLLKSDESINWKGTEIGVER